MADRDSRDITPTPNVITNILTLRYDPSQKPILPKKTWCDFLGNKKPSINFIEESISNSIREKIDKNNVKTVAIALSGGIDSTLILSLLRKTLPDVKIEAISIRFADSVDETGRAKQIAEHFNINHHIIPIDNYLKELPEAVSAIRLPFWDLHWFYVVKKAKTLAKYLASGDGGDELFGGYTFRYEKFLTLTKPTSTPLEKIKAYLECHERDRVPDQENLFGKCAKFSWDSIYKILEPYFDNSLNPLEQVFLADYNGKLLYNFSPVNTAIHNYFGIENVAPLLSDELISYGPNLSYNSKYDEKENIGKIPLRNLLKKYGADHLILDKKFGFNVNTLNLWKTHGQKLCEYYLSDARTVQDDWINKSWIDKYLQRNNLDVRYVNKFLGLLAFEIWYRLFVTKEMKPTTILE